MSRARWLGIIITPWLLLASCGTPRAVVPLTPSPIVATPSINPDVAEPVMLPDASITPGAVLTSDPGRICVSGYTQTVRVSLTVKERDQVDAAYHWTYAPGAQEYDHLIPLELGGANGLQQIWPEPIAEARIKDRLEGALHAKACRIHTVEAMQAAQSCIRTNWWACYLAEGKP